MGCGPGIGGALMDDLIYPRLWLVENNDKKTTDNEDSDHDIRKLFPRKISSKKSTIHKISKKGTPEWLAMSVGVFFIGALFTIASYQVYSGNFSKQLSHLNIYDDKPVVFADEPHQIVYNDFTLPPYIIPISYMLYLSVNIEKKKYSGLIKIYVICKHNTSQLILHSALHKINKIEVKTADNHQIHVKNWFPNKDSEMLILSLNESLTINSKYHLLFGFGNNLTYDFNHGIYLTSYKDGNGIKHDMLSTDLEPTRARKAFPCFDEPAMKATWKIIVRPEDNGYHAISNMPIEKTKHLGGKDEIFFQQTPVMSSYLVVIAVTEYVYREVNSTKGVKIRAYAPVGRLNETNAALKYASFAVNYFSNAFGIDYMLPKLDMFPVSKFSAAADETWGNIIFNEDSFLLDHQTSSESSYKYVAEVVSHEISHQWFGDLVTMKWWNDLWLKESFAAYLETLPVGEQNPSWDVKSTLYTSARRALGFDSSEYTHPIESKEINSKKLLDSYDTITYEKGAAVVNMFARFIGNEKFLNGLKVYLKRYSYKNADIKQLWEALSEESRPINVVDFMNSWVTKSGYPVITIKLDGDKFLVEQEKYMFKNLSKDAKKNSDSTLWHIPLRIKICDEISQYLLSTSKGEFRVESSCNSTNVVYKANFGSSGYYRVNYDNENWLRLLGLMKENHLELPAIDRGSLLYDLYSLVSFNYVDITLALDFTQYMGKEHSPEGWSNGMMIMSRIRHVFYHTKLKKCVEEYTLEKITPVLDYLNSIDNHNHEQITLIQLLLSYAVSYNMQPLSALMENKFLKWIVSDGTEKLPVNTRGQILTAGIMHGDVFEWAYVNKTRMNAKSVSEQHLMLSALTYTKDKELLKRIVDEAEKTLSARALRYVCDNRLGRDMAWKAVNKHWKSLFVKYKGDTGTLKFLLTACLGGGTNVAHLKDAQEFVASTELGRFKVYAQRAIEYITHNIDFARHERKVVSWFRNQRSKCLD